MGEVKILAQYGARRRGADPRPPVSRVCDETVAFYFDPCCPFSYLAAEGVERRFANVDWLPVPAGALTGGKLGPDRNVASRRRPLAEQRAAELRVPLIWPERFPEAGMLAVRVADYAARIGLGSAFALAATRLFFCGGFDLDEADSLVVAAAAAGIGSKACLRAMRDDGRDQLLLGRARGLRAKGVGQLPAFKVGSRWFVGEAGLAAASAWSRCAPPALALQSE